MQSSNLFPTRERNAADTFCYDIVDSIYILPIFLLIFVSNYNPRGLNFFLCLENQLYNENVGTELAVVLQTFLPHFVLDFHCSPAL